MTKSLRISRRILIPLGVAAVASLCLLRTGNAADVEVGQPAPDFTLPDQDGKPQHLADYHGRSVILAFYPKDFTAG